MSLSIDKSELRAVFEFKVSRMVTAAKEHLAREILRVLRTYPLFHARGAMIQPLKADRGRIHQITTDGDVPEWVVDCGKCQVQAGLASRSAKEARAEGYSCDRTLGWVCRRCASDVAWDRGRIQRLRRANLRRLEEAKR